MVAGLSIISNSARYVRKTRNWHRQGRMQPCNTFAARRGRITRSGIIELVKALAFGGFPPKSIVPIKEEGFDRSPPPALLPGRGWSAHVLCFGYDRWRRFRIWSMDS